MKKVLLLNGPNLGMLGKREPAVYGHRALSEIVAEAVTAAERCGIELDCRQSNHEGVLIDWLNESFGKIDGVIVNPGGLTHSSVALRDALSALAVPVIEVHLSNIYAREPFRQKSLISDMALGGVFGLGPIGYRLAVEAMAEHLNEKD